MPDHDTNLINCANLIDLLIDRNAPDFPDSTDDRESLCNDLSAHYISYYADRPIDFKLIQTMTDDLRYFLLSGTHTKSSLRRMGYSPETALALAIRLASENHPTPA